MNTKQLQQRIAAFFLISGIELISYLILPFVPFNDWYFFACASFNAVTLYLLSIFFTVNVFTADMARLTVIQMFLQFVGWFLYSMYITHEIYNAFINTIVVFTFIRIILIGPYDRNSFYPVDWNLIRATFSLGRYKITKVHKC